MISQAEYLMMEARLSRTTALGGDSRTNRNVQHDGPESDLHEKILEHCKSRGWICFHGSMAHRTKRTSGEPDFTILADRARVFFVEAKSKTGKRSMEQLGLSLWAEKLGHKIHLIRSMQDFGEAIKDSD